MQIEFFYIKLNAGEQPIDLGFTLIENSNK